MLHRPNVAGYELASVANTYRDAPRADPWRLPSRPAVDDSWRAEAACKGWPLELWYPRRGQQATAARSVCDGCPVRQQCLNDALSEEAAGVEAVGIRAGLTARQRRRLRRDRHAGV